MTEKKDCIIELIKAFLRPIKFLLCALLPSWINHNVAGYGTVPEAEASLDDDHYNDEYKNLYGTATTTTTAQQK